MSYNKNEKVAHIGTGTIGTVVEQAEDYRPVLVLWDEPHNRLFNPEQCNSECVMPLARWHAGSKQVASVRDAWKIGSRRR